MSLEDDLAELQLDHQEQPISPRTIKRPPNPIATWLIAESPPSNPWFTHSTPDSPELPPHPESLAKRQRLFEHALTPHRHIAASPPIMGKPSPFSSAKNCASPPANRHSSCVASPIHSPMQSPISPIRNRAFSTQQPMRDDIAEPRPVAPRSLNVQHGFLLPSSSRSPTTTSPLALSSPSSFCGATSPVTAAASCVNHTLHLGEQHAPSIGRVHGGLMLPPSLLGTAPASSCSVPLSQPTTTGDARLWPWRG